MSTHIFFSHTHLDHIMGLPFFKPAYQCGNGFQLWSGHLKRQRLSLQHVLYQLMETPYFPVPLDILHACIGFHDFDAGEELEPVKGVRLQTVLLNHPGGATAYRTRWNGRSFCYVTDTEHVEGDRDERLVRFIEGSQLVIYDCTYTDDEFQDYRGWGHSTWQEGVRLCRAAGVPRLVAFHHDPCRDDTSLDRIALELDRALPGSVVAREGLVLEV